MRMLGRITHAVNQTQIRAGRAGLQTIVVGKSPFHSKCPDAGSKRAMARFRQSLAHGVGRGRLANFAFGEEGHTMVR